MKLPSIDKFFMPRNIRRVRTPTLLQMEAVECGAAALGIILSYFSRPIPLAQLRSECGVSRDGSKASNILKAARIYGLDAKAFKKTVEELKTVPPPFIVFWNFNHFLVVEGIKKKRVYLNDPASGPRTVSLEEFKSAYTGVVLTFEPGLEFKKGGKKPSIASALDSRLQSSRWAIAFCLIAGLLLTVPRLAGAAFTQIFVDEILVENRHEWLRPLILGMLFAAAIQGLLARMRLFYLRRLANKLSISMSGQFLWHTLRLPVGFYAQRFAGEISSRCQVNDKVADILSGKLAATAIDAVMMVFYAIIMVMYDWVLTSVAAFFALLNFLALQSLSRSRVDANTRLAQETGKVGGVAIALFAAKIQSEEAASNRHYLFGASAGEALFGTATNRGGHGGTVPTKRPVALLPGKGSRYTLFDPIDRTRQRVTKAVAQQLSPEAQMFYRPLPLLVNNAAQLFRFGTKGYEKDIIVAFGLGILGTLLGMVTPQATSILVNDAIPDSDLLLLWQLGLVLLAAAIGRAAFSIAQTILTLRIENAASGTLQPAVWDRMLRLKPTFFRNYSSGDLLTRLLAVNQIRAQLSGATQRTLLSAIFSLLNLGLMFVYSLPLALVGIGLTFIAFIVTVTSSLLLIPKERKMETGEGDINGLTVELINGVSKLRVAAAEGRAFAAWAKKYSQQIKLKTGIKRIDDSVSVFNEALPLISSILIFWFAILFVQTPQTEGGGLNMGTFLAFNSAFGTFIAGITDLSNTLTDILGIVPLWERAKPIVQGTPESDPTKADPGRLKGQITVDRATFRYRSDGPPILDDVSISIQPGEFIAIVGPSGSGKSTLFRLLLGFEIAQTGTVYYDNQDLAGLDVQAVRRQLGVVLQNGRINAGSMFDNITCGAVVTQDEAWEAARMAGLAADIEQMPMGMHTVVSEGGTNLSGGQRQRLLIARAMVVKPKVILMDEATSALDNRTQAIVTESLDKLNVTRIVIAHRLSTIRNADRIYVIEAGRLVEFGSFDELVKQGGLFARLVERQLE